MVVGVAMGCQWGQGMVGDGDRDGDRVAWQPLITTCHSPSQGPAGPRGLPGPPGAPVSISPALPSGDKQPQGPLRWWDPGWDGRGQGQDGASHPSQWLRKHVGMHVLAPPYGGTPPLPEGSSGQIFSFLTHFFLFFFFSFFLTNPQGPQGFQGPPGEPGEPGASVSPVTSSSSLMSHRDGDKAACSQPWL